MKRRFLNILLALCMMTWLMPASAFAAQGEGANVLTIDPHIHRLCADASCTDDADADIEWSAWESSDSLPSSSGSYYLLSDVTLSGTWTCGSDVKLCLNGHTITGPNRQDVIKVNGGASLVFTDCHAGDEAGKITHASGDLGRGIDNDGALTLWNGSITGNSAGKFDSTRGGVHNTGTFTMHGGSVAGNWVGFNYGGGVYNDGSGTFIMTGGSISGNTAYVGGGVYNTGTFAMSGGSIAGNSAGFVGGGVYNIGRFAMSGGSITGNSASTYGGGVSNGDVYYLSTVELSGDAVIKENTVGGEADNLFLCSKTKAQVTGEGMGENASVGVTCQIGDAVVVDTSNTKGFFSDRKKYAFRADGANNCLRLAAVSAVAHKHKVCGVDGCEDSEHGEALTWTAVSSLDDITKAGNYYLTGNVTLSDTWTCAYDVNLCLNGYDITGPNGQDAIKVSSGASLAITDHRASDAVGKITHADGETGRGIANEGTLTLWNGSIAGNSAEDFGVGVLNHGTFAMHDGAIAGNSANFAAGVYNTKSSTFAMTGGSIAGNAARDFGGGVVNFGGAFAMTGGNIAGNSAGNGYGGGVYNDGGALELSGNVTIEGNTADGKANNVYLFDNKAIAVAGGGIGENASVGITAENPGGNPVVVSGTADTKGFFSDDVKYVIGAEEDGNGLKLVDALDIRKYHKICGVDGCEDSEHGAVLEWKAVWSPSDIKGDGNYYLLADVTLSDTWTCAYDVNLCLNGYDIIGPGGKDAIKVSSGASLAITDCHAGSEMGKITHAVGETGRGIANEGTLTLWNGRITGNSTDNGSGDIYSYGGGVYSYGGAFTMYGGRIDSNSTKDFGGGVCSFGAFTMYGGRIIGNSAGSGGGVCNYGAFTMSGGTIDGNSVDSGEGGGVCSIGTLNLSGDVAIKDNTADGKASNVLLSSGSTVQVAEGGMGENASVGITAEYPEDNPIVVRGTAAGEGFFSDSVVYALVAEGDGKSLRLIDARTIPQEHKVCGVDGCEDSEHGEVLTWKAVLSLSDIKGDGNYYLLSDLALDDTWTCAYDVKLCLNGKTIAGPGGKDTIKVNGGASLVITDCHANDEAGKITHVSGGAGRGIDNYGTLTFWNGRITGNSYGYGYGAAVSNNDGATFDMRGGTIAGNSSLYGGGIYNTGAFAMYGGTIAGNVAVSFALSSGGGVCNIGTFDMRGGAITGNSASLLGGGVCNAETGTFAMSGGSVTGNSANNGYGGGVYDDGSALGLSGNVTIEGNTAAGKASNVFLTSGHKIQVAEGGMGENASVGITAENSGGNPVVVAGTSSPTTFFSDDADYEVVKGGDNELKLSEAKSVEISDVELLLSPDGSQENGAFKSKVYDAEAVAYDAESTTVSQTVPGAELVYTWQKKDGDEYVDIASNEAPKAAGGYRLAVTYERDGEVFGTAMTEFSITPKTLDVAVSVRDKIYDGTTAATVGDVSLDGVVSGDDVSADRSAMAAVFDSAGVGESKSVTVSGLSLAGADAGNYELAQPVGATASITAYNAVGSEYTATSSDWTNQDFTVTAAAGWKVSLTNAADGDWRDSLTCSEEGEGSLTFYVRNEASGFISQAVTLGYKIDKTAPTGMVEIGTDSWTDFLETVTFDLYRNGEQIATLAADDALSGVASVGYLITGEDLGIAELASREFVAYSGALDIEPDASLILYARVADKAGNVTYLRSDGVVLDATAPVISGAQDGRTYCGPVELTVTDANLDTVTLNGAVVEVGDGEASSGVTLTVQPAKGEQVVVVTDKVGIKTVLTLTVNDGHDWGAWVPNGDGTHTRTCKYDSAHTETAVCHGGEATCVGRAVCDDCGHEYGELDEANHAALAHIPAKAATAEAEGNIEYWYCEACGKYFADAAGTKEIQRADTIVGKTDDRESKTDESSTAGNSSKSAGGNVKSSGGQVTARTGDGIDLDLILGSALLSGAVLGLAAVFRKRKRVGQDL